jgi:AcrR family transcriptional regulator
VTNSVDRPATSHAAAGRGDATRGRIVEATVQLIAEVGWAAVTTRAVARRAVVTQGLIHYHFGSKEALLRAAVISAFSTMIEGPTAVLAQASDLRAGLRALVDELGSIDAESPLMLVSAEALALALRDRELGAWMREELSRFRAILAGLVARASANGDVRADLDPEATAVTLAALLDGLLFHAAVDPGLDRGSAAAALATMLAAPAAEDRKAHRS